MMLLNGGSINLSMLIERLHSQIVTGRVPIIHKIERELTVSGNKVNMCIKGGTFRIK